MFDKSWVACCIPTTEVVGCDPLLDCFAISLVPLAKGDRGAPAPKGVAENFNYIFDILSVKYKYND
ncbi:hypothetical protein DRQ26_00980 [bacterium]|nr:MAG: hypothetical protein DRQ26_00980 [bacterium]